MKPYNDNVAAFRLKRELKQLVVFTLAHNTGIKGEPHTAAPYTMAQEHSCPRIYCSLPLQQWWQWWRCWLGLTLSHLRCCATSKLRIQEAFTVSFLSSSLVLTFTEDAHSSLQNKVVQHRHFIVKTRSSSYIIHFLKFPHIMLCCSNSSHKL